MHHIGLDGWSSLNMIAFLGVIVCFLHNGEMKSIILDFIRLTAANNDTMLQEPDVILPEDCVAGSTTRVRCICHAFNLTVKAILDNFTVKKHTPKQIATAAKVGEADNEADNEDSDKEEVDE
ncbi:hypothetical protein OF83DRAFT_1174882 [Amylostereum chailletii]|nr:hypothetical protein OF83DRAFT_1174882 [Amylostereum chailletii]